MPVMPVASLCASVSSRAALRGLSLRSSARVRTSVASKYAAFSTAPTATQPQPKRAVVGLPSGPAPSALVPRDSKAYATATPAEMYTASFAFFEALWDAGVTHCFVNLGSDHPSIIEAMVKGQRERKGNFPRIITCPNEVSAEDSG